MSGSRSVVKRVSGRAVGVVGAGGALCALVVGLSVSGVGAAVHTRAPATVHSKAPVSSREAKVLASFPKAKRSVMAQMLLPSRTGWRAPKNLRSGPPPGLTPPGPPFSGLVSTEEGPVPPGIFFPTTMWQGEVGSQWWTVFAGQEGIDVPGNPALAGIIVYTDTVSAVDGLQSTLLNTFWVAGDVGSLTIDGVMGNQVSLTDSAGTSITYQLGSATFTGVPTVAGWPTAAG